MRRVDDLAETVLVLGDIHDPRVDAVPGARGTEREQRQAAARAQGCRVHVDDEALRALVFRRRRARAIRNLHEHGDAVALSDCLAQPSSTSHGS